MLRRLMSALRAWGTAVFGRDRDQVSSTETPERWFVADAPIHTFDEDTLGRKSFATALADVLRAWPGNESLVVGICGDWGAGKSSVKNMVLDLLRRRGNEAPYIVEFNPWHWSSSEEISRAFFREVYLALGKADPTVRGRRRARKWQLYSTVILGVSGLLEKLSTKLSYVLIALVGSSAFGFFVGTYFVDRQTALAIVLCSWIVMVAGGIALRFGGRLAGSVAQHWGEVATHSGIEEIRAALHAELQQLDRSILVVIDDIDRLSEQDIRLVFRHIKVNGDFPRLIYLLLFQRETVERSLMPHWPPSAETSLPQTAGGRGYLEKLVQVIFDLPHIPRARIESTLFGGLDKILMDAATPEQGFDQRRWGNLFIQGLRPYFRQLRDVYRLLASLSVHIRLLRGERILEVNPIDAIAIEALRLFEPDVYHALAPARSLLTGESAREDDAARAAVDAIVAKSHPDRRDAAGEIIKQLFPTVEWAFRGGHRYDAAFRPGWAKDRRVCSTRNFNKYFGLTTSETELSNSEMIALAESTSNRTSFVRMLAALTLRGLLSDAISRLDEAKTEIPIAHAAEFVPALFDIGDQLDNDIGAFFGMSSYVHAWRIVYWYLLKEPNVDLRSTLFVDAMKISGGLAIPAMLLSLDEQNRGKKEVPSDRLLLTDAALTTARALWVQKIKSASELPGRLLANKHLAYLINLWSDWGKPGDASQWVQAACKADDGVLAILVALTSPVRQHSIGDAVATTAWMLRLSSVERFTPVDGWEERLSRIPTDQLAPEQLRAVQAFRRAVKRRKEGKSEDWHSLDDEDE